MIIVNLQGQSTHIDTFQTNFFSWFNDTVIKRQWFLGFWDREIWYKTFFFMSSTSHGLHGLRKKRYKKIEERWAWGPHGGATPLYFWLRVAEYWCFYMRYIFFLYYHYFYHKLIKGKRLHWQLSGLFLFTTIVRMGVGEQNSLNM